jgi:hypothetical protein
VNAAQRAAKKVGMTAPVAQVFRPGDAGLDSFLTALESFHSRQ